MSQFSPNNAAAKQKLFTNFKTDQQNIDAAFFTNISESNLSHYYPQGSTVKKKDIIVTNSNKMNEESNNNEILIMDSHNNSNAVNKINQSMDYNKGIELLEEQYEKVNNSNDKNDENDKDKILKINNLDEMPSSISNMSLSKRKNNDNAIASSSQIETKKSENKYIKVNTKVKFKNLYKENDDVEIIEDNLKNTPLTMDSFYSLKINSIEKLLSWYNPLPTAIVFIVGIELFILNTVFNISWLALLLIIIIACLIDMTYIGFRSDLSYEGVHIFITEMKKYTQIQFPETEISPNFKPKESNDFPIDSIANDYKCFNNQNENISYLDSTQQNDIYIKYLHDIKEQLTKNDIKYLKRCFLYQMHIPNFIQKITNNVTTVISNPKRSLWYAILFIIAFIFALIYPAPLLLLLSWVLAFIYKPLEQLVKIYIGDDFSLNKLYSDIINGIIDVKNILTIYIQEKLSNIVKYFSCLHKTNVYHLNKANEESKYKKNNDTISRLKSIIKTKITSAKKK